MSESALEVVPCPAGLVVDAVSLALSTLAPEQRDEVVRLALGDVAGTGAVIEGLVVALEQGKLQGAAWGQRQPGNTAILWPPQLGHAADRGLAEELARRAVQELDSLGVQLTQVLLPDRHAEMVPVVESVGFHFLAELVYLSWETTNRAAQPTSPAVLHFEPYDESQSARMMQLLEDTYQGTLDCPAMNGLRTMKDVICGYQQTGDYRPSNWLLVHADARDVGVLLLAEHQAAAHWELVYMGLLPEARGRGWGGAIVRHAQRLVAQAGAERLVLAVDAANQPALAMYRDADFFPWDKRTVYVRIAGATS